jgi:hypothetical protein
LLREVHGEKALMPADRYDLVSGVDIADGGRLPPPPLSLSSQLVVFLRSWAAVVRVLEVRYGVRSWSRKRERRMSWRANLNSDELGIESEARWV